MDSINPKTTLDPMPSRPAAVPSDAFLIGRSLDAPEQFAEIFDRHWSSIHAYCTSRAGASGEDLAAESFRLAFDHRARYDQRVEDARPWLYGIATNLLRQHFRSTQRRERAGRKAVSLAELNRVEQPLQRLEEQALGPRLAQALERLPALDREALLLLAWAELDYREIARALGIPVGTVRSRIHRARARVRAHITSNPKGELRDASAI